MREPIENPLKGPGYFERNYIFDLLARAGLVQELDYLAYYQTCTAQRSGYLPESKAREWAKNLK